MEKQMEWVRSEKDEQIAKLSADRKNLHDRVHEAETQLSQFKARKREELKVRVIVKTIQSCSCTFDVSLNHLIT
jgi:phage shock protein A